MLMLRMRSFGQLEVLKVFSEMHMVKVPTVRETVVEDAAKAMPVGVAVVAAAAVVSPVAGVMVSVMRGSKTRERVELNNKKCEERVAGHRERKLEAKNEEKEKGEAFRWEGP